jgi:hypothetical protein
MLMSIFMGRLLLLLIGCSAVPVGESHSALGEPSGDFPNYDERVVLYATNRARVEPAKENWSSYPAVPPLQWNLQLNQSARAHSTDMRDTPCFQHNSCDGTDVFQRITGYYTTQYQSIGENISAGVPDGVTAVHNWINEIGAAAGETGHRDNIFSQDFTLMGSGFAAGGSQFTNYWTQDFIGNPVTRPAMSDGIHFPQSGKSITFGVTWSDAAAPASIVVVVDGTCSNLNLVRGSDGQAAYEAALSLAGGCHQYYFRGVSSSKKVWLYPDTGSLQVGCSSLFASGQMSATAASCGGPLAMPDMAHPGDLSHASSGSDAGTTGSTSGTGGTTGISLTGSNGGSNGGNGGGSNGGNSGGSNGGGDNGGGDNGGSGCSIAASPTTPWALLIFLALPFALRRRLG